MRAGAVAICAAAGETSDVIDRIEMAMRQKEFMRNPAVNVIIG
jgi:hypothetical protein